MSVVLLLVEQMFLSQEFFNNTSRALETEYKYPNDHKGVILMTVGAIIGIIIVAALVLLLLYWWKKKYEEQEHSHENLEQTQTSSTDDLPLMTSTSLTDA